MAVLTKGCTVYAQSEGNSLLFPSLLTVLTDLTDLIDLTDLTDLIDLIDLIPFPPTFQIIYYLCTPKNINYGRIFHV